MEPVSTLGINRDDPLPIYPSNSIIDLKLEMPGQDFCMENFPSSASKGYLQDFNHLDHFPVNSSRFDPDIGIHMDDGFDHFDPFFRDSSSDFEFYKNDQEDCGTSTGAVDMQSLKDAELFLNFLNKKYPPMEVGKSMMCQDPKPLSFVFHDDHDQNSRTSAGNTTAQTEDKEDLNVSSSQKLETVLCPVDQMPEYDFDEIPEFSFDDDHDLFEDRVMESFIGDIPRDHLSEIDDDLCFDVDLPFDLHI